MARNKTREAFTQRALTFYGDGATAPEIAAWKALNLLGKPVNIYDESGRISNVAMDFKGNLLEKKQQVIADTEILSSFPSGGPYTDLSPYVVDWDVVTPNDLLDTRIYTTTMQYDALNRPVSIEYPEDKDEERKILVPSYNRAGALERVSFDSTEHVKHIAYNALHISRKLYKKQVRIFVLC